MKFLPARLPPILQFVVLAMLSGCTAQQAPISLNSDDYPYYFRQTKAPERAENKEIFFIDLDGDANDEKLILSTGVTPNESNIIAVTLDGKTINQTNLPPTQNINFGFAHDITGDGTKEVFISTKERDTIFAYAIEIF